MRYSKSVLTFEGNAGSHPSEDELEEFVFGRLDGAALDHLEEHLLVCDACRRRLSETENFVASTRAASRKMLGAPPPTPKPRRFSPPAWAMLGAFAVVLVAVGVSLVPQMRPPQTVELVAERGTGDGQAVAGRPLDLRLNLSGAGDRGVAPRWLEIVSSRGDRLHTAAVSVSNGFVVHRAPALPSGQVWIRLYPAPSPEPQAMPLREFSLRVQ